MSWIVSIFLMLIKGDLFNHGFSTPLNIDFIVILMVYLLGRRCKTGAGVFALGQGLLMDIFSGGIWGFNALLYLLIYMFIKIIARPFDLLSFAGQLAVVFLGVLAKGILIILLFYVFSLNSGFSGHDALLLLVSAICSGVIAPFVLILVDSLGRFVLRVQEVF
jgi:rod shape-determining protein MreD